MLKVSYLVQDDRWRSHSGIQARIRNALKTAYGNKTGRVSFVLSNDAAIQTLNNDWRGKNKPTNVLSFPCADDTYLGDVILAYETITQEARDEGKDFIDHVLHLSIHGLLHLMGHDHENEQDALRMEALEIKVLKKLGIANPYADRPS